MRTLDIDIYPPDCLFQQRLSSGGVRNVYVIRFALGKSLKTSRWWVIVPKSEMCLLFKNKDKDITNTTEINR